MNKLQITIAAVVAIGAVALLTPVETKASLYETWMRLTGDPGFACFEHQRSELNDPITARLQRQVVLSKTTGEVAIAFAAKNTFGAYISQEASCIVKDGKVDAAATVSLRAREKTREKIDILRATADCLHEKNQAMLAGRPVNPLPCPGQ